MQVERVVTSGRFTLDGGSWEVENNVWLVGDDREVVVIDAAHDADAIAEAVAGRAVRAIVCTHAHDDHVGAAPRLAELTGAPVLLHPADHVLWKMTHWSVDPDGELDDGHLIEVAGGRLVLHTPGHAPGAVCLYAPEDAVLFSGDTLFQGGPGATGRSFSDSPRSWTRSATGCSPSPQTRSSTPATGRTPASASRRPPSTSGSAAGASQDRKAPCATGTGWPCSSDC